MKLGLSRICGFFACVGLLFLGTFAHGESLKLSLIHMNDIHTHYLQEKNPDTGMMVGGLAQAAAVIKRIRTESAAEGRHTLTLFAGDLLTGTPFSTVFKGRMGIDLLNRVGLDAMTPGNHEFDYGSEHLIRELRPLMKFPLLSANILDSSGTRLFPASTQRNLPNSQTKVLIIGLTTDQTPISTFPKNVEGLSFPDPLDAARDALGDARDEDLVIALTHIGVPQDKELAEKYPKIDIIVGGHTHTALQEPVKIGNTLIVQAGAYSRYVGRLDVTIENGRVGAYKGELIALDDKAQEDPEIAGAVADYRKSMSKDFDAVIGEAKTALLGGRSRVRSDEPTPFGVFIAYAVAEAANAQVGIMNGGGIRSGLNQGPITMADMYTALPFPNFIVSMKLKGSDLRDAFQKSHDLAPGSGGKLQMSGVEFTVKDEKVEIQSIGNTAFDPEKLYTVAANDFLVAGGDGYKIFKEKAVDTIDTGLSVTETVVGLVRRKGIIP